MARILLAPDSFKGSASSIEVADAISRGWLAVRPNDQITQVAFADGGEGTLDAIESSVSGSIRVPIEVQAADGKPHQSYWLLIGGEIAVIEMAMLCGISTIEKLDALGAHSYGLGQAISAAISDSRVREILIAVGGSASTDAGVGALMALGAQSEDSQGDEISLGGGALINLKSLEMHNTFVLPERGIKILVDVQSPMTGSEGAAHIFARQKGADNEAIELLDRGLKNFLSVVGADDKPGYGAAGGVSGGLAIVLGAEIVSGVETLACLTGVLGALGTSDVMITGEGTFDSQSYRGKVVGYLLAAADQVNVPAMVVCGVNKNGDSNSVISLVELAPSIDDAIKDSHHWLQAAGEKLASRFESI